MPEPERYLLAAGGRAYHRLQEKPREGEGRALMGAAVIVIPRCQYGFWQIRPGGGAKLLTLAEIEALRWARKPHPCKECFQAGEPNGR